MSAALESLDRLRKNIPPRLWPGADLGWISALRRDAYARFEESGIPTRRLEEWKGTSFAPLSNMNFTRVGRSSELDAEDVGDVADVDGRVEGSVEGQVEGDDDRDGALFVFVDGEFEPRASSLSNLPAGIRASSLADVLENEPELVAGRLATLTDLKIQPLVALASSFLSDGAVLAIDPDTRITQPVRLRFVSTGDSNASDDSSDVNAAAFPRLIVIAGKGSECTLLQEHVSIGSAPGFTAYVAEFHLAESARIETVEIQANGPERIHFTSGHARLGENARFDSHVLSVGRGLVRSELSVMLAEPDAETKLCGLFMGRGTGHVDHFTTVDHAAERCTSDEDYRGILANESRGVFRGRVIVRPGAQKTDARQSNANLLLSESATIDTKPQLEIYADDIRASHGSTIGQLDADALFFLRARGLDESEARRLLTRAFARGIVDRITSRTLRAVARARVDTALAELVKDSSGPSAPRAE